MIFDPADGVEIYTFRFHDPVFQKRVQVRLNLRVDHWAVVLGVPGNMEIDLGIDASRHNDHARERAIYSSLNANHAVNGVAKRSRKSSKTYA